MKFYSGDFKLFGSKGWDRGASVRASPNRYALPDDIEEQLKSRDWFLPGALPWLSDPSIQKLGVVTRHNLLARYLVFFLDYTAELEHKIVNPAVEIIAHDALQLGLPYEIRNAAFQLYTDEGYHALVSAALSEEVCRYYGASNYHRVVHRVLRIQQQQQLNKPWSKLAKLVSGFVSETSITKELLDFTSKDLVDPSYHLLHDHLMDEVQHSQFFHHAFSCVWSKLDEKSKDFASVFMKNIILEFFRLDDFWLKTTLSDVGISEQDINRIQCDLEASTAIAKRTRSGTSGTVKSLKLMGFFDHKANLQSFRQAGLVDG